MPVTAIDPTPALAVMDLQKGTVGMATESQREIRASMSACMRSLYSSDQWAPGFALLLSLGFGVAGVLLSLGDFRAPALSLRVVRGAAGLEEEFELFMQLLGTYCGLFT
jgi:hypothetical protein